MGEEVLILNDLYEKITTDIIEQGYSVTQDFMDQNTLFGLLRKIELIEKQNLFAPAAIGKSNSKVINSEIRKDKIYWIESNHGIYERTYLEKVKALYEYLNFHCFTGISGSEFLLAKYETGSFYKKHVDSFHQGNARKLSIITYLNQEWAPTNGGALVLYPIGKDPVEIIPEFGKTIIFKSSEMLHEVMTTLQPRYSITGWLK